jgi:hypothetical protein
MSLQPLPPELQDILRRAMRTQYVVLPAQAQPDGDDDDENEIIQQILNPRIYFEDFLLQQTKNNSPNQAIDQQTTDQTGQQQITEQTQAEINQQPQTNKITKAQALSLRLILGFAGALLLILGLLTAISSDYLDQITESIKDIFQKKE